jgi:hypothetical protein
MPKPATEIASGPAVPPERAVQSETPHAFEMEREKPANRATFETSAPTPPSPFSSEPAERSLAPPIVTEVPIRTSETPQATPQIAVQTDKPVTPPAAAPTTTRPPPFALTSAPTEPVTASPASTIHVTESVPDRSHTIELPLTTPASTPSEPNANPRPAMPTIASSPLAPARREVSGENGESTDSTEHTSDNAA